MVITLEYPFSEIYRKGYLRLSKDGRKRVDLFNTDKDRTTISYARYIMCVKAGHVIPSDYEIDHIDGNNSNDDIENLQVLKVEDHRKKNSFEMSTGRSSSECICNFCGNTFTRENRELRYKNVFCNNVCRKSYQKFIADDKIEQNIREYIVEKFVSGSCEFGIRPIARKFGLSNKVVTRFVKNNIAMEK